jgi:hypothetical protein
VLSKNGFISFISGIILPIPSNPFFFSKLGCVAVQNRKEVFITEFTSSIIFSVGNRSSFVRVWTSSNITTELAMLCSFLHLEGLLLNRESKN